MVYVTTPLVPQNYVVSVDSDELERVKKEVVFV